MSLHQCFESKVLIELSSINFIVEPATFKHAEYNKAVVGGPAGPATAGPLFLPEMVLAGPHFWPNMFFAGPFSHVSSRPSLMIYFSMIKD